MQLNVYVLKVIAIIVFVLKIMTRPKGVYKKRKLKGNQHIMKVIGLQPQESRPVQPLVSPTPSCSHPRSTPSSLSRMKLSTQSNTYNNFKGEDNNIIISMAILTNAFKEFAIWRLCHGELRLLEVEENRNGLACQLSLLCLHCDKENVFWTSNKCRPRSNENLFEVNIRMFYGLRCIEKGGEGCKVLCGLLNLPRPSTAYTKYTKILKTCISMVAENSMIDATKEAVLENNSSTDKCCIWRDMAKKRFYIKKWLLYCDKYWHR